MAATATGRRLTEDHRQAQLAVRAELLRDVVTAWAALDPGALDRSVPSWLELMLSLVGAYRARSARTAMDYLAEFRTAETGLAASVADLVADADPEAVSTSLLVTGPVRIKQLTRAGRTPEQAAIKAFTSVSGAASRHVLTGGRDALTITTTADPVALGWIRVTDADPCYFCALLASRGPVYDEDTVHFEAHDGCGCTGEPVYDRSTPWPGRNAEFARLYRKTIAESDTPDKRAAFRAAYAAQRAA